MGVESVDGLYPISPLLNIVHYFKIVTNCRTLCRPWTRSLLGFPNERAKYACMLHSHLIPRLLLSSQSMLSIIIMLENLTACFDQVCQRFISKDFTFKIRYRVVGDEV